MNSAAKLTRDVSARPDQRAPPPVIVDEAPDVSADATFRPATTPPVRSRGLSHRQRALLFVLGLAGVFPVWWGSGYVFAYTDDAYLTSDLVSIAPEVAEPVNSVDVLDNHTVRAVLEQSIAQHQAAEAALRKAIETLGVDRAAVATALAALLLAEWRLDRTKIVARVDGYVTHLTVHTGDMVSPSRPVVAIVDGHAWRVEANFKEYYLRHFRPGHVAWVWLDSRPWHLHRARIQGLAHSISRDPEGVALLPYVSPTADWIRLQRRIPQACSRTRRARRTAPPRRHGAGTPANC